MDAIVLNAQGGVLGDPAWQGIGALAGILALVAYLWFDVRRRRKTSDAKNYRVFTLASEQDTRTFYVELAKSIRNANESIYRAGRGFSRPNATTNVRELIDAEEGALRKGVEVTRIQTSTRATEAWAESYATLLERYPEKLRVVRDFAEPPLVNVALIDPYSSTPTIQLLFEAQENTPQGQRHRGASAIFLYKEPALAASLAQQFSARASELQRMTPADIRDLARSYIYFAYGSNVSKRQMRERCPQAEDLGRAVLYGWRLRFGVQAPHMGSAGSVAAGVEVASDESSFVEGVAYAILPIEKERLDDIERGGYRPEIVGIKLDGGHQDAYMHAPLELLETDALPPESYLDLMLEGANEHRLSSTVEKIFELRRSML